MYAKLETKKGVDK